MYFKHDYLHDDLKTVKMFKSYFIRFECFSYVDLYPKFIAFIHDFICFHFKTIHIFVNVNLSCSYSQLFINFNYHSFHMPLINLTTNEIH